MYTDHGTLKYLLSKKEVKHRLIQWIFLLQEFDIEIHDKSGVENLVVDHLSRLESGIEEKEVRPINDHFPHEQLFSVSETLMPWYGDFVNYLVCGVLPLECTYQQWKQFFTTMKNYLWEDPFLYKICSDGIITRYVPIEEIPSILHHCHSSSYGGDFGVSKIATKVLQAGFFWPTLFHDVK